MNKQQMGQAVCECGLPAHGRGLCNTHYRRAQRAGTLPPPPSAEDRFWFYVRTGSTDDEWPWAADCFDNGYGKFWLDGKSRKAHRVAWQFANGPIPEGMTVDHLCHDPETCMAGPECPHRRCCNTAHMALKPIRPNVLRGGGPSAANARKTHCKRGHPFDEVNTRRKPTGGRVCRTCVREQMRERRAGLR